MRKITAEEFKRVDEQQALLDILGYKPFNPPKKRWMSNTVKYYRKNDKNSGISAVNWSRLAETVR